MDARLTARQAQEQARLAVRQTQEQLYQAQEEARQAREQMYQAQEQVRKKNERAQKEISNAQLRTNTAERHLYDAQEQLKVAEQRLAVNDSERPQWAIRADEIELAHNELGRGGWATVELGTFRGTRVAAKLLHEIIISDYNRVQFIREMNIAARIRHPNLVQFMGATLEGRLIIVTELMCTSLRAELEKGELNSSHIVLVAKGVACALNYLHLMEKPIIHRDVSSSNVLLERGPRDTWKAKLSDYGSANFVRQTRTEAPGNMAYSAPEAKTPHLHSPKMDVYSYGVLLLEMVTRQQPGPDPQHLVYIIARVQDHTMKVLIQRCLQRDCYSRPTMQDVLATLDHMTRVQ